MAGGAAGILPFCPSRPGIDLAHFSPGTSSASQNEAARPGVESLITTKRRAQNSNNAIISMQAPL
jgi:hypothetical protein